MRQALGTAVFSGMIGVTLFGIFLTPVFFSVIMKFFGPKPAVSLSPEWVGWPYWDSCFGGGSAPHRQLLLAVTYNESQIRSIAV
ncbi:MAG: hypothetical protein JOZ31_13805 [Verrucomicrobia bacterium]|nr:hypothetical protein [Verrucomicrobiota bacterium]